MSRIQFVHTRHTLNKRKRRKGAFSTAALFQRIYLQGLACRRESLSSSDRVIAHFANLSPRSVAQVSLGGGGECGIVSSDDVFARVPECPHACILPPASLVVRFCVSRWDYCVHAVLLWRLLYLDM